MKLSTKERFLLLAMMPQETNFATLKVIRTFEDAIGFNDDEIKELKIRVEPNRAVWDVEKDKEIGEKEFTVGPKINDIITAQLKKLDSESKLTKDHMSLYQKFITE